jgi:uncharacterized membrane protein
MKMSKTMLKWIGGAATLIFLFSTAMMCLSGAPVAYSLFSGACVVASVLVFLIGLLLPLAVGVWLTVKIAPEGECCSCLAEAVFLRARAKWHQSPRS